MNEAGFENNDKEHATLLKALEEFRKIDPSDHTNLIQAFDEIATVARQHFHNEEKLMQKVGYDLFERHQREHISLLDTVAAHRERLVQQDKDAHTDLWEFLLEWVTRHTYKDDLEFKTYYYQVQINSTR